MKGIHYRRSRLITLFAAAGLSGVPGFAQVPFSAGSYIQSFNSLASAGTGNAWSDNATLPGWYAAGAVAPFSITAYRASRGTDTAGALYSFGASSSSERALGVLASGGTGNVAFGVRFLNDTPQPITDITISYTGEEWRSANATAQTLAFSYRAGNNLVDPDTGNLNAWTSVAALGFTSPVNTAAGALDGNAPANRQVFNSVPLTGLQILPGQELFLRWYATKASSGSGDGLGIDDLTVTFKGPSPVTKPPTLSDNGQPASRTNNAGTTATFAVSPDGTPPFTFRWWKGATRLSDGGNVSGSASSTLSLTNVLAADAGSYWVGITNSAGGTVSAAALLTVKDPAVLTQPTSRTCLSGDTAVFEVIAGGTPPLGFQWYKDGNPLGDGDRISGANSSTLHIANLGAADVGKYQVVVGNARGAVSSANVVLSLYLVPSGRIALWTFNDTTAPLDSPPPSLGKGSAWLLNGVTATWAAGGVLDPAPVNLGWNTANYPALTESNKAAGAQFRVSTVGYTKILVAWEQRNSSTASKYTRMQYSADGFRFNDLDVDTATATFAYYGYDFTGVAAAENNPNFAFRIVSEFESTAAGTANDAYVPTTGTNYSSSGTVRLDMVGVFGEPSTPPPPVLRIQLFGQKVVLSWSDATFALQSAPAPAGATFTNVPGAASPYTNTLGGSSLFFRLRR